MTQAAFAVPGALETPTGGYAYARRLLREAPELTYLALPGGYPYPTDADLAETARRLRALPKGQAILIDGLALGVLPGEVLRSLPGPVVALCHHPLALETGVSAADAVRLRDSECAALEVCAQVLTTSATTAAILTADYGVAPSRLTVAPPGTDAAPRAVGSGGSGVAILSVGSLTPRKGHDVLVAALAGLADLNWALTIAGPGRGAACARELEALIARQGFGRRIRLCGPLDAAGLEQAYARADLFVLASRYEGFGMVYTEAMARGLATVGTSAGAISEATRGGARLVAPDDAEALRTALRGLIADGAARRQLAEECWQAAQGFTRWPETARMVLDAVHRTAR